MTSDEFDNALARAIIENRPKLGKDPGKTNTPVLPSTTSLDRHHEGEDRDGEASEVLEVMEPGSLDEIGGLDNLKEWIAKRAHCFGQEARDFGIEPPKGAAF
jgi:hypothetical protein